MDSVSVGCGCGTQRGSVHCYVPSVTLKYKIAACTVQQLLSSSLLSFPNSFKGIGGLEGIQVLKRGGKVFFFFFFEVPKSFFVAISNNQKQKKSKNKKENPAPVDIEYGRKKDLWCILHNVTVT